MRLPRSNRCVVRPSPLRRSPLLREVEIDIGSTWLGCCVANAIARGAKSWQSGGRHELHWPATRRKTAIQPLYRNQQPSEQPPNDCSLSQFERLDCNKFFIMWCPEGDLNPHGLAACGF